jgi:hypothetical protein
MIRTAILALALAGCAVPEVTSWTWTTSADPGRDERFLPKDSRWRGGDAIYSVPLTRDRILWLFGDSFIAAAGGRERAGSRMIRNSLALETPPGSLDYFWRTGPDGQPRDALGGAPAGEWTWPLSGLRVGPSLHLFVYRVKARGDGAFGFSLSSTALGTVDNPGESPDRWTLSWVDVPLGYGSASLLHEGYAYVYGASETGERALRLARTKAADLAAPETWRYWTGRDWSSRKEDAAPLFDHAPIELSVAWLDAVHGFVAVTSAPHLSPEIQVRRSPRPEGPWSRPETIFRCPEADWKKGYFCYAAKGHPELDPTGRTLAISYAVNSFSFADAVGDLRIYRPRFIVATPEPAESPRR